ncbi:MAG TPA: signal peptidase I [Candidatus Margulisiibacteriota bacterium]|nr:signal peptidase I [Candidatus Margulisiibacteriota bacterium]
MNQSNRSRVGTQQQPRRASRWAFWRRNEGPDAPAKSHWRQNFESLFVAIVVALLVRSSVVEAFWVPSGSMLPTIQIGDHLFVNKLAYGMHLPFVGKEIAQWRPLQRDDIVVFTSPVDHKTDLIKRVIAVEGDTVEIRNKHLYINGQEVPDPHANFTDPHVKDTTPRDKFGPVTVPPGKFFVMGDNRDQSYDSRYWGFADASDVKGKATFIYWSWNSQTHWLRWDRFGHVLR